MSAAPGLTVLAGGWNRSGDPGAVESGALDSWNRESVAAVEIVTPDRYCATLLLDHAASVFPAELVPGPGWVVRFRPPPDGRDWVVELLALVERWLQSAPLPCAKVLHGERNYLVRAPAARAGRV